MRDPDQPGDPGARTVDHQGGMVSGRRAAAACQGPVRRRRSSISRHSAVWTACSIAGPAPTASPTASASRWPCLASWNGRFLFQGGGGLNGSVRPSARRRRRRAALRHWLAASPWSRPTPGTPAAGSTSAFMREQQASLDFAYQAVGGWRSSPSRSSRGTTAVRRRTLVLRRLLDRWTRGDADGAAPPDLLRRHHRRRAGDAHELLGHRRRSGWPTCSTRWRRRTPAASRRHARRFSDANKKAVIDGLLNACDASDGVKDGDGVRHAVVQVRSEDAGRAAAPRRTAASRGSRPRRSRRRSAGPKDSKGRQVYPRFLCDTGIAATQGIPGLLHGGQIPVGLPFYGDDDGRRSRGPRPRRSPAEPSRC